jgi:hypothetical protein
MESVLLDVMISSLSIHFRSKHAPLKFVPINVCISHERKVASSAQEIAARHTAARRVTRAPFSDREV